MANITLASIGRGALDLLYPPRCAVCGSRGDFLCAACLEGLPRADGARCDVCWSPLYGARECRACAEHPLALERLRTAFRFEGEVRRLVHKFKFGGLSCLAPALAQPMREVFGAHELGAEIIVPVPLTGMRRRTRGYNQAALLAREIARGGEAPVVEALRRRGFAGPQARSSSAVERRRNVENAFAVGSAAPVAEKRVLLIDDITTTGSTLDACARALIAAGATAVTALTLARED